MKTMNEQIEQYRCIRELYEVIFDTPTDKLMLDYKDFTRYSKRVNMGRAVQNLITIIFWMAINKEVER